ncbi:MAG: hypothetical protein ABI693_03330 [Bryobacteraceae bacterium]
MPRRPQWFLQVPQALAALAEFPAPVVDRSGLETLLSVGRRDAIRLMHRLGGYQSGGAFVIGKEDLRRALGAIAEGDTWQWEVRRREKVAERLSEMRQDWAGRQVVIPVAQEGLPDTIRLAPQRLEVTFKDALDLLGQLVRLTQAMSSDYEGFERLLDHDALNTPTL